MGGGGGGSEERTVRNATMSPVGFLASYASAGIPNRSLLTRLSLSGNTFLITLSPVEEAARKGETKFDQHTQQGVH